MIWRFFDRRGITYKKRPHAAEKRADMKAAREAWFEIQIDLDPDTFVLIDETGATTKMA